MLTRKTQYKRRGVRTGGVYYPRTSTQFDQAVARYRANRAVASTGYYGRISGSEMKFLDTTYSQGSDDAGQILGSANLIAQGAGESQRVGRKVMLKKISIRGYVQSANTANQNDYVRLICYLDKQCNGANAAVTDILETDAINSFNNLANKSRFKILRDMKFSSKDYSTTGQVFMPFEENIKCNIPLEFDGATGAITEIRSNNIGFLLIGQQDTAANPFTVTYTTRVRYSDN